MARCAAQAIGAERDEAEAKQLHQRIGPADNEVFPEQKVAEQKEKLLVRPEGRDAPDQQPKRKRAEKLRHLHEEWVGGEA